ncbi:hypothetical protein DM01DRAFT_1332769 [Hesseltinella vesiculosa]|uniref:Uncharacterized protein n=1 Tax=Hesseltinella vesiculosa TaxID=101127 RepID=A0A1X2GT45_9FUNG|nr:hypothetical protein DM01DRAFT_1332769 [Hesseltinella vesiculosa]
MGMDITNWLLTDSVFISSSAKQLHDTSNDLERKQTEYNYIMSFLYPLLQRLLRGCPELDIMW